MKTQKFEVLLAKSYKSEDGSEEVPTYARLVPHLRAVEHAGVSIVETAGALILQQLELPLDPWLARLSRALRVACLCHDLGKANDGFQKMVRKWISPTLQPARHELLSALLLVENNSPVREWALNLLSKEGHSDSDELEMLMDCIIGAIAGHHLKLDEQWNKALLALKGGCGTDLAMLLTHADLQPLFSKPIIKKELSFSLLAGDPTYLGNKQLPFNMQSNRWKNRLKTDATWLRFAAVLKALLTAADVAGSAMLPEKENIRKWVSETLSQRISAQEMKEVVNARLKGNAPRPFQEAIGNSISPITLVEAGCGTGKTAAAYLWAAHHAHGKKLFFCYPTTGTATEGFLGYVHETDVEAKLIHSRAIIDLEQIAEVSDDDEDDHLLRIESLNAWSPKVIICTVDTVLALVRNNRRGLYNSPSILSASFVFDEIHAYDNRLLEGMVSLVKALPGAHCLLMSASLPKDVKDFLLRELRDVDEVPSPADLEQIPRYEFLRLSLEDAYSAARAVAGENGRVLWVCNTVSRSQRVFEDLIGCGASLCNYHSRFKYVDREKKHRKVVYEFSSEIRKTGTVAVTTQVAEMSLDLDADLLISEVAPIPSLIQRLGRLNRRLTTENRGLPRKAIFIEPESSRPYAVEHFEVARKWLDELIRQQRPLSQSDVLQCFNRLAPETPLKLDTRTAWLDSGWLAMPEPIRDLGYSVSVILPEDMKACSQDRREIIRRAIPMNYDGNRMNYWREFKGNLIAPEGAVAYNMETGAVLI